LYELILGHYSQLLVSDRRWPAERS
jgi:hypothetical protein